MIAESDQNRQQTDFDLDCDSEYHTDETSSDENWDELLDRSVESDSDGEEIIPKKERLGTDDDLPYQ